MALCEIHLGNQNALHKMTSAMVILPENAGPGPFPAWQLPQGLSDDHTAWTRRTRLERSLGNLPLIVVMPDGGRGFTRTPPRSRRGRSRRSSCGT